MTDLASELQKMYDSEIHVDIGWLWDGGIDVSIGGDEFAGQCEDGFGSLAMATERDCRTLPGKQVQRRAARRGIRTEVVRSG
jgi:hypothetical protein